MTVYTVHTHAHRKKYARTADVNSYGVFEWKSDVGSACVTRRMLSKSTAAQAKRQPSYYG